MRHLLALATFLAVASLVAAAPAAAGLPKCTGKVTQKVIYSGQGVLESVTVGGGGSLYVSGFTQPGVASLWSYVKGGPAQDTVTTAGPGPGGLAWNGKRLLWGYGNTQANGQGGDLDPKSGLYSVNVRTGQRKVVSSRLGMANGVARAADGTIFSTNDFGLKVDSIRNGETTNGWASVQSGNGLVVGRNQKYLYVNQTFVTPSRIARVSIENPAKVWTFFSNPAGTNVIFDGLARDSANNLYVAALSAGEVWKVTPDKRACVLASGLVAPSSTAISFARKGYRAGNLYVVGFGGEIVQVSGATAARVPAS